QLIRASDDNTLADRPGGVFLRKATHLSADDKALLQAAARVVLVGGRGSLAAQLERLEAPPPLPEPLAVHQRRRRHRGGAGRPVPLPPALLFANGHGGFTPDGREYCVLPYGEQAASSLRDKPGDSPRRFWTRGHAEPGPTVGLRLPPAPWVNVI